MAEERRLVIQRTTVVGITAGSHALYENIFQLTHTLIGYIDTPLLSLQSTYTPKSLRLNAILLHRNFPITRDVPLGGLTFYDYILEYSNGDDPAIYGIYFTRFTRYCAVRWSERLRVTVYAGGKCRVENLVGGLLDMTHLNSKI
jgi:hypothetical protein